ncbi:MAG: M1 family metallopeptidase [Bryobacteraceae bacterium]
MRAFFFVLLISCALHPAATAEVQPPKLRLGDLAVPSAYALDLRLVPEEDRFSGSIEIDLKIRESTPVIWLNAQDLEISKAVLTSGARQYSAKVLPGGGDFVGFEFAEPVPASASKLRIEYSGILNKRDVEGLFKQTDGGRSYIFTQFEPLSGRRAFPSYDEPSNKVPWDITLRVKKEHGAFANTPIESEREEGGMKVVKFARTKPIPTYLVAMAVGPFDVVSAGTAGKKKTPLRVLVPRGRAAEAAYTIEVTPKIFNLLEEYFGIPYPYEKLDQVAIPITVGFGAMENVGLITYNQFLLLSEKEKDSLHRQRLSAEVITHEIAHQWFGNMVTPVWWDDIWLNEAFASWMEAKILDQLHPEWKPKVEALGPRSRAMSEDALTSARRIRQPIESNGDIGNAFDAITYSKGGAVISMFENYLGPELFRQGVQHYMKKHAWGNATASDFLNALSESSQRDISSAFSSFLDKGGVPLVTVELQCEQTGPTVALTQKRFLPTGSEGSADATWQMPVCFKYGNGSSSGRECHMVTDPRERITLKNAKSCPAWLMADENSAGYYHVLYKGDLQERLAKQGSDKLTLVEKVGMLRNVSVLFSGGVFPAKDALALVEEFGTEPAREVVQATVAIAAGLEPHLVSKELRPNYARFIQAVYGERARALGWQPKAGESEGARLLRPVLVGMVAGAGQDKQLTSEAKRLAEAWLEDRKAVSPDVVAALLLAAARTGDADLFKKYVAEIKSTKNRTERSYLIAALKGFPDRELYQQALQLLFDDEVDTREFVGLVTRPPKFDETRELPWLLVKQNFEKLASRLPTQLGADAGAYLPSAASGFCTIEKRDEAEEFLKERVKKYAGSERQLAQVLEGIQLCAARKEAQEAGVTEFLKKY